MSLGALDQDLQKWSDRWNSSGRISVSSIVGMTGSELTRALSAEIPREFIEPRDLPKFESFADRIGVIYEGCVQRRGYTTEAINFFQEFNPLAGQALAEHVLR